MKKVFYISFFLLGLLFQWVVGSVYAQIPPLSDMSGIANIKFYWGISFEPRGNIRSFKQELFEFQLGSEGVIRGKNLYAQQPELPITTGSDIFVRYDTLGYTLEEKINGQVVKYIHVFDEHGNLTEQKGVFDLDKPDDFYLKLNFVYDADGNLVEEILEMYNYSKKQTYQYDAGKPVKVELTELFGGRLFEFAVSILEMTLDIVFDLYDDYESDESRIPDDRHLEILRTYDAGGNLAEESVYSISPNKKGPDKFIEKNLYQYDTLGNITEESKIAGIASFWKGEIRQKLFFKGIHFYDEYGYRIGSSLDYPISGRKVKVDRINNYKGDPIEINEYEKGVTSSTAMFEYDRYDNFTKLYIFTRGKPKYLFDREIEYYE